MTRAEEERIEPVGLVGLGLMGQGIASSLIAAGCQVVAFSRTAAREKECRVRIAGALERLAENELLAPARAAGWEERFSFTGSLEKLAKCPLVIETVKEDLELKREIYDRLERSVSARTVIASNTSSIPIALLQAGRKYPGRFIGMHWAEPAEITRYLEITRGGRTTDRAARLAYSLGKRCGKEPSILNFDIRGFISNRLMYAMLREACHLVEIGVADIETVDRSFRNDIGWWATIAGPFRWMDLTGIPVYAKAMEGLFPELCSSRTLPELMKVTVESGAEGISNRKGFYKYTAAEAKEWEKVWLEFTVEIRKLSGKYEKRVKL